MAGTQHSIGRQAATCGRCSQQKQRSLGERMSAETYEGVTSTPLQSGTLLSRVKAVAGAGIGNVLEWYDFTVYAYLAGILGTKFFVVGDENTALLATFALFGVGFVARPLGGLLIGLFGDKYGRKPALLLTFLMIACSTGLIGILPTYASIGIAAPILLVLARLMQAFRPAANGAVRHLFWSN